MRIDAHQHFWNYNPVRDTWITEEMRVLQRDFLPEDLEPLLRENNLEGCVTVQADQSLEETEFLLKLAEVHSCIKGVVGWVDLKSKVLTETLTDLKSNALLKGFRHILQAEPSGFMTDPAFVKGVSTLDDFGFTYDILVYHHQLPEVVRFVDQLPVMRLVIDHCAKPDIKKGEFDQWAYDMKKLAAHKHLYVKISGLVTEADWKNWKTTDFQQYIDRIIDFFGSERILFGSDWPVCLLGARYDQVVGLAGALTRSLSPSEQAKVFCGNAIDFYGLKTS